MSRAGDSVILEEQLDENYEPSHDEILEYAQWLGMDVQREPDLVWIAREGLKAPLPEHWKPCRMPDNDIYYFNFQSGESTWDHPCDDYYRKLYAEEKKKRDYRLAHGLAPSSLPQQPAGSSQNADQARKKFLPALQYTGPSEHPARPAQSDRARWEGESRANGQQEEIASSRRSSANSEIVPGQAWPKKSAPLPTKDSSVPRYEPYAQRQPQQSRQEWAANSPQNMNNGDAEFAEWERDGRPPPPRFSPLRQPPPANRNMPSPPRPSSSSQGGMLNRSTPQQWASNSQSPPPNSHGHAPFRPGSTPSRSGGVVADWSDSDTTEEEEEQSGQASGMSGQKRRLSKEPAEPDEHILKAQEAAHRREFLQRQRQEREEWEKDVLQKERAARDQWENDVLKDMDDWKRQKQEQIFQERQVLEDEYNEHILRLQDDEDSNMSQLAAASQDRLAAVEGRHRAEFEALKQERDQLLHRAATENRQLREAAESGKPLPSNLEEAEALMRDAREAAEDRKRQLMEEAQRGVEEAKRAMLQQARIEVEGEKQRMIQMINAQLRKEMEERRAEMEPQSPHYSPSDDRTADPSQKVHRWKAIMQEETISARQKEALAEKLRQEEEEMYDNKRRELEERVQERMRAEEENAMQVKRAELEASLTRAFEKEKGDREISMRFEIEKEMQSKRKSIRAEIEQKYRDDSSGSPSGFMANLLPGQQLTEAQLVDQERAQMLERVRLQVAREEEQLLKDQREGLTEKVKRTLIEEGERSPSDVEDKRMSEDENRPFQLDRSLSMEELQEGFRNGGLDGSALRAEIDRAEEEGRAQLVAVKKEVERQVKEAREKELAAWEAQTGAEFEAEKERRVAQMRSDMEMLVKSERLQLARQRQKDLAEAKKKAEEERLAAEATPTPVSVLPGSAERVASELELRAQQEQGLKALRDNLEKKHAQTLEKLNEEQKRQGEAARSELERERNAQLEAVRKEAEAELEALRERLEGEKEAELRRLEEEKREELQARAAECEKGALQEKGVVERERKEALEGARAELAAQLEELSRAKEEELEGARKRIAEEGAAEEQRLREAMEDEVAEKVKTDRKRRLEEEKKKEAELKKEMKARQEFQRAKLEGELEREIRREREKRSEALRKELEAKEQERRSQAEEDWRRKAAQLEDKAAADLQKLKAAKRKELEEDQEWLEKEMEAELDRAREEIERAKELRLQRLKKETQQEIEKEEEKAEQRKKERLEELERAELEARGERVRVLEEARREGEEERVKVLGKAKLEAEGERFRVLKEAKLAAEGERAVVLELAKGEAEGERFKVLEQVRRDAEAERTEILEQVQREGEAKRIEVLGKAKVEAEEEAKKFRALQAEGLRTSAETLGARVAHGTRTSAFKAPEDNPVESQMHGGASQVLPHDLRVSTERLMEDLRKERVTSPERMDRHWLGLGNGGGNGLRAQARSTLDNSSQDLGPEWSRILDAENEKERNVDLRSERSSESAKLGSPPEYTTNPNTASSWQVESLEPAGLPADVAPGLRGISSAPQIGGQGSPQTRLGSFGFDQLARSGQGSVHSAGEGGSSSLDTMQLPAQSMASNKSDHGSAASNRVPLAPPEISSLSGFKQLSEISTKRQSETLKPLAPSQLPPFRSSLGLPSEHPSLAVRTKGSPAQSRAGSLESSPPGEEPETPRDDFEDMESLASTVMSARASVGDAGTRAWDELQLDVAQAPLRASSLPVQPSDGCPPSLSLPEKARAFLSQQRKYLKERQLIIEQARGDWKKRLQELDQVREPEERQHKRGFLMQLKATLEDAAHRVNEEARQMRTLKHELLSEAAQPASALAGIPVFRTFLPGRSSSHPHRWSVSSELNRPHTADAAARKRASWTGAPSNASESGRSAQFRRTSEREAVTRPPQARDPLPGKLMSLLVRWNDERQIAGDLAREHALWMAAFWEKLRAAGAVMDSKQATKR